MSCLNIITPEARRLGISEEAKRQRLRWPVPEILGRRQAARMAKYAESDNPTFRAIAANNPDLDPKVLAVLACDDDSNVRARVALNPHCPEDILRFLTADENEHVKTFAAYRLSML